MRFVILGAGAVGAVLGIHLAAAGHEVVYVVRRAPEATRFTLIDAGSNRERVQPAPVFAVAGESERVAPGDCVLVCVRGDQVEGAVASATEYVRAGGTIGIAAAVTADQLAGLRRAHAAWPLFTIVPTFNAWPEGAGVWRWVDPWIMKTMISGEDEPRAVDATRAFVRVATASGLRVRAVRSAYRLTLPLFASGLAVLAAWELAGWGPRVIGPDRELRALAARAMGDAARVVAPEGTGLVGAALRCTPATLLALVLRALPLFVTKNALAMWTHHGPKIQGQTRAQLDELLARARTRAIPAPRLAELRGRLPAEV